VTAVVDVLARWWAWLVRSLWRPVAGWWMTRRARRKARQTARAQRRLDAQQLARARRARRKNTRRRATVRAWAAFRPVAFDVAGLAGLVTAGFCTALLWGIGVGLVVGFVVFGVASLALGWRVHGD